MVEVSAFNKLYITYILHVVYNLHSVVQGCWLSPLRAGARRARVNDIGARRARVNDVEKGGKR